MNRALPSLALAGTALTLAACGTGEQTQATPTTVITITRTAATSTSPTTAAGAASGNPDGATITRTSTPPPATVTTVAEPPATPTATKGGTPRGLRLPPSPDATSPEQVADATLLLMYSSDTAIDKDPSDATRRATIWMTPKLANLQTHHGRFGGPGADWLTLTQHKGYYAPKVQPPVGNPTPVTTTGNTATVTRTVHVISRGADQWMGTMRILKATVTLTNTAGAWRVSTFQIADQGTVEVQP